MSGLTLFVAQGSLRWRGGAGRMTLPLKSFLAAHRDELIALCARFGEFTIELDTPPRRTPVPVYWSLGRNIRESTPERELHNEHVRACQAQPPIPKDNEGEAEATPKPDRDRRPWSQAATCRCERCRGSWST
jgi:hypothetical protein